MVRILVWVYQQTIGKYLFPPGGAGMSFDDEGTEKLCEIEGCERPRWVPNTQCLECLHGIAGD